MAEQGVPWVGGEPVPALARLATGDGGHIRHARWPSEGGARGTVLLLPGRCEFIEKYEELAGEWRGRGFQVLALDWRGHGLSSRFLDNPQKCHSPDYALHVADLGRYLEQVVRPQLQGPLVVFAHSMGGLITLRALVRASEPFAAVILSAPMVDIETAPWPRAGAEMVARSATGFGLGSLYAFGQGDYDPAVDGRFEDNPITGDPVRFARIHEYYRRAPELRVGGVTFGWLAASFRAQALAATPGALSEVRVPVLVLVAPEDRLVPADPQEALCQRLRRCIVQRYPGARHDLMMEGDAFRTRVWADIDGFLASVLK